MTVQAESSLRLSGLPDQEACWALLERVASSAQLRRSARLQELLFYIGTRYLKDGCDRVHEQEIGAQVFKRPESYDTGLDNIVRTNVSDLRKRIEAYFQAEGSHEPLIVEIPRGGYTPVFRYRTSEASPAANIPLETPAFDSTKQAAHPEVAALRHSWMPATLLLCAVLIVALAIGCLLLWSQLAALHRSFYAWQFKPSVAAFWSEILNANPETDIVTSDTSIGLAQTLSHRTFQLDDYLSRSYVSQLQAQDLSPDMRAALNRILAWNLGSPDEFKLAQRILALDPPGKYIHLYSARFYMADLFKRNNVILIGARKSNPWDELFESRTNFLTKFNDNGLVTVVNRSPVAGEQQTYTQVVNSSRAAGDQASDAHTGLVEYCVVAYLPNPAHNGIVLLIEGTDAEATEAAGDFLLSDSQLSNFEEKLHVNKLPFFEVLLKVSSVRGTPLTATVEAYRTYANL
jgi:hypothetical protein